MNNMIKTALEHALIAVIIQLVLTLYLYHVHTFSVEHGILAGGFTACAGFLFREMSQHEYKGGGPKKVSIFYGLTRHWTLDSALDVLFPIISTGGLWMLYRSV